MVKIKVRSSTRYKTSLTTKGESNTSPLWKPHGFVPAASGGLFLNRLTPEQRQNQSLSGNNLQMGLMEGCLPQLLPADCKRLLQLRAHLFR